MKRFVALALTLASLSAACGSDDPADPATGATTIPVVTEAPPEEPAETTTTVGSVENATTTVATSTTTTVPLNGELGQASVTIQPLTRIAEPVDTAVAANGELWVALREGRVVVLDPITGDEGDTIIDISSETAAGGERGLLGLATDGENVYINFTDLDGNTSIDAFVLDGDGRPGERHQLLAFDQPFANHNGGALAIGPDGHLYIGAGDGGAANDPLGAGQDATQLLGSILRIDPTPDAAEPYAIPADNPFADGANGQPEIFMTGARNPWRISFDPVTDDFWVADVGQNEWEEIDLMLGANGWGVGQNLGWNLREGTHEFAGERPVGNVDPVFEYPHSGTTPSGCSISGGVVYRGSAIPDLVGSYVFGDFCESTVWAISIASGSVEFRDLGGEVSQLVGITADADGELLVLSLSGEISRILPA